MDMMNSIASSAMSMSAAQFEQQYSISVQKKAMETQELALQELQEMLPTPPSPYGFDVRA
jgi:hypothetical protein